MSAPTEEEIREALLERLEKGDHYASDDDWISYLSDGLGDLWPGERLPNGDSVTSLDRELDAMVVAATAAIGRKCQELAIVELTKVAVVYRDRVANRTEYRARLLGMGV